MQLLPSPADGEFAIVSNPLPASEAQEHCLRAPLARLASHVGRSACRRSLPRYYCSDTRRRKRLRLLYVPLTTSTLAATPPPPLPSCIPVLFAYHHARLSVLELATAPTPRNRHFAPPTPARLHTDAALPPSAHASPTFTHRRPRLHRHNAGVTVTHTHNASNHPPATHSVRSVRDKSPFLLPDAAPLHFFRNV